MNKTDFWTGAIVGAAAALLISNKRVQGKLAEISSNTEETLKSSGENLKEAASSAKENIQSSSEILKEALQEYIEKHGADLVEEATEDKKTTTTKK